ncbi:MAG: hypothetical protein Q8M65_04915, partial [Rhodoglobus sp.]|nr:hypothetical protein [Rhodoglobus sp.]
AAPPEAEAKLRARPGPRDGSAPSAIGGEPRVSLLPNEVNDLNRLRATRRRLVAGTFGVLLLVAAAVGGSMVLSTLAQLKLDSARSASQDLLLRESDFAELRSIKQGTALAEAAQQVGASTEIEWKSYLEDLQGTLPAGVIINSVVIDSASPFADFGQSSAPLQASRVATLSFTAVSPTIPDIPVWLNALKKLVGFADAVPESVLIQSDGTYIVNMTMHINAEAYSHRFPEDSP